MSFRVRVEKFSKHSQRAENNTHNVQFNKLTIKATTISGSVTEWKLKLAAKFDNGSSEKLITKATFKLHDYQR